MSTTTLNDSENEVTTESQSYVGQRLQAETTAVRLRIRWPGVRKTLSADQRQQAASAFDADTASVSASKKLLDTSHPAFRAATAVKTQAVDYWKRSTLPYIEPGETIDLAELGRADIRRGSHVEPSSDGLWTVDLSPVAGPRLGPFRHRSAALQAENQWLSRHWLVPQFQP